MHKPISGSLRMRTCWLGLLGASVMADASAQTVLQTFPLNHSFDEVFLIGDVDADGVRDLAINRYFNGSVDIYSLRAGALRFQLVPPPSGSFFVHQWIKDLDGDLHDDIGCFEFGASGWQALVRSGQTGLPIYWFPIIGWGLAGLDDVTSDGRCELLATSSSAVVNGMVNAGRCDIIDGATGQVLRSHLGTYAGQELHGRAILGDMDGDGVRDYLVASNVHFWGYSGATGAQIFSFPKLTYSYGEYLTDIGDFNADGYDDIVFRDRGNFPFYTYEQTRVFAGPTASQLLWSHTMSYQNPGPIFYDRPTGRLGDMDGDGHDDLGLLGGTNGVTSTIISGRNHSALVEVTQIGGRPAQIWASIGGPGDVNDDGVPDLLLVVEVQPGIAVVQLVSGAPPGTAAFGTPCPDQTGIAPTIGIGIGARLGRTMTVNLSNSNPNRLAVVLGLGFSAQTWNGMPLPLDLGPYGMPGCNWYIAGNITLILPTIGLNGTRHHTTHSIPVPQNSQLLGLDLYCQWLVLEAGPLGTTGSTTRAMRSTVVQ